MKRVINEKQSKEKSLGRLRCYVPSHCGSQLAPAALDPRKVSVTKLYGGEVAVYTKWVEIRIRRPFVPSISIMRGLLSLLLLCFLICFGFLVFRLWPMSQPEPGITRYNSGRIRVGATQKEVEAIMGCQPHSIPPNGIASTNPGRPKRFAYIGYWSGPEVDVWVFFDDKGRALRSAWSTRNEIGWFDDKG